MTETTHDCLAALRVEHLARASALWQRLVQDRSGRPRRVRAELAFRAEGDTAVQALQLALPGMALQPQRGGWLQGSGVLNVRGSRDLTGWDEARMLKWLDAALQAGDRVGCELEECAFHPDLPSPADTSTGPWGAAAEWTTRDLRLPLRVRAALWATVIWAAVGFWTADFMGQRLMLFIDDGTVIAMSVALSLLAVAGLWALGGRRRWITALRQFWSGMRARDRVLGPLFVLLAATLLLLAPQGWMSIAARTLGKPQSAVGRVVWVHHAPWSGRRRSCRDRFLLSLEGHSAVMCAAALNADWVQPDQQVLLRGRRLPYGFLIDEMDGL